MITFTYRIKCAGYYKSFFWERISVSGVDELVSSLKVVRAKERASVENSEGLLVEVSPYLVNPEGKSQELSAGQLLEINNKINES